MSEQCIISTTDAPIRATSPHSTRSSVARNRALVKQGKHTDLFTNLRNLWVTKYMVPKPEGYLFGKIKRREYVTYRALATFVGKRGNICVTLDKLRVRCFLVGKKHVSVASVKDSIRILKMHRLVSTHQTSYGNAYSLYATGLEHYDRQDDDTPYRWAIQQGHASGDIEGLSIKNWYGPGLRFKSPWQPLISEWKASTARAFAKKYAPYGGGSTPEVEYPDGWQAYLKRLHATTLTVTPKHIVTNHTQPRGYTKEVLAACVIADRAKEGEAEADPENNLPAMLRCNPRWHERIMKIIQVPKQVPEQTKAVGGWYKWMKYMLNGFFGNANKDHTAHDDYLEYWKEALVDPTRCEELVEAHT